MKVARAWASARKGQLLNAPLISSVKPMLADDVPELIAIGLASLTAAFGAGLLSRPIFATFFVIIGAFALVAASLRAWLDSL
jgi:hypothetical protein